RPCPGALCRTQHTAQEELCHRLLLTLRAPSATAASDRLGRWVGTVAVPAGPGLLLGLPRHPLPRRGGSPGEPLPAFAGQGWPEHPHLLRPRAEKPRFVLR